MDLEKFVNSYKDIITEHFGILDPDGVVMASSNDGIGRHLLYMDTINGKDDEDRAQDKLINNYQKIVENNGYLLIPFKKGRELRSGRHTAGWIFIEAKYVSDVERMIFCQLLKVLHKQLIEKYGIPDRKISKKDVFKNIILKDFEKHELLELCRNSNVMVEKTRIVYIFEIKTGTCEDADQLIQNIFPEKNNYFSFIYSPDSIVMIYEIKENISDTELKKIASAATDTLMAELLTDVFCGIGTMCENIYSLRESYKMAAESLMAGKIFECEKRVFMADQMGISRLIMNIPERVRDAYIKEIVYSESTKCLNMDDKMDNDSVTDANIIFDEQTMTVARKLFENNLNVSEAARKSFLHRNTFLYRLSGLEKNTGLDLRKFDDAVKYKLAMMLKCLTEK